MSDQGENQQQTQPGEDSQLISDKKTRGELFHYYAILLCTVINSHGNHYHFKLTMNSINLILIEVAYRCHFYCQEERFQTRLIHLHLATSRLTEAEAVCSLSCNNSFVSHMKLGHHHPYRKEGKPDRRYEVITKHYSKNSNFCSLCV